MLCCATFCSLCHVTPHYTVSPHNLCVDLLCDVQCCRWPRQRAPALCHRMPLFCCCRACCHYATAGLCSPNASENAKLAISLLFICNEVCPKRSHPSCKRLKAEIFMFHNIVLIWCLVFGITLLRCSQTLLFVLRAEQASTIGYCASFWKAATPPRPICPPLLLRFVLLW